MNELFSYKINIKGKLFDLSAPQVMGIINVTPDSFYSGSRKQTDDEIRQRVEQILSEGGTMIDIGAYSSRPNAAEVSTEEEKQRLTHGMKILRELAPDIPVSVDTFRADVAKMCVEELGVDIINDISGGALDKDMFATVAKLGVPYFLMHFPIAPGKSSPFDGLSNASYDNLMKEVLLYFAEKVQKLRDLGQKDIILDPGFGFAKTLQHNYTLMNHLEELQIFELPILSGISRKSMIYKLLGTTPQEALNGTSVLNMVSLEKGARILRVHDVKECVEVVKIFNQLHAE